MTREELDREWAKLARDRERLEREWSSWRLIGIWIVFPLLIAAAVVRWVSW